MLSKKDEEYLSKLSKEERLAVLQEGIPVWVDSNKSRTVEMLEKSASSNRSKANLSSDDNEREKYSQKAERGMRLRSEIITKIEEKKWSQIKEQEEEPGNIIRLGKYTIDITDKPRYQRHNTRMALKMMGAPSLYMPSDPEHLEWMKKNARELEEIDAKDAAIKNRLDRMVANRENRLNTATPEKNTKQSIDLNSNATVNKIESDEIFTATNSEKRIIPHEIEAKYRKVGNKYYLAENTKSLAFEDKGNRLETKSNNESTAETMVKIAYSRGWDEIKVSGTETFKKEAWLAAASMGMSVKGYNPTEQDKVQLLNKAKSKAFSSEPTIEAVKKYPELANAAAIQAAINEKTKSDGLTPEQKNIVNKRINENIAKNIEKGTLPTIKLKVHGKQHEPVIEKEYTR